MFRNPRSLLFVFFFASLAALLVFSGDPPDGGRTDANRDFLAACEASPFAAGSTGSTEAAVRVCSCILSWHRKEGGTAGQPLPASLYGGEGAAGSAAAAVDARARAACLSGRVPH
ncbi:hypothetical protein [Azospirillum isscasi]|uniref:Secreted protein n=1 Tax=Azospirillum isscasi TaxID=3053926 RepID=A0ABU0WAC9_9PROT|nr:hypothetical protein [Azospirillum isscasi]MDQ2101115.1 hypothetical protein [Azospirillum isscasi]